MRALIIAQERQAEADNDDDQMNAEPLDRAAPVIEVVYGACPGALPARQEAEGRVDPHTLRLELGQSAEMREVADRGMNPQCFYTGGYTYGVSCCPRGLNVSGPEFFAVSVSHDASPISLLGTRDSDPPPGMIQIWSLTPLPPLQQKETNSQHDDAPQLKLEYVLHTPQGAAAELEWRPLAPNTSDAYDPNVLGHLAGVFPDGNVHVFQIPHPAPVRSRQERLSPGLATADETHLKNSNPPAPLPHIETAPLLTLNLIETEILSLNWGGHSRLATGCANGWIAIWDLAPLLVRRGPQTEQAARPVSYYRAHESLVTKVRWSMHPEVKLEIVPPQEEGGKTTSQERALWNSPPDEVYSASHNGTLNLSSISGDLVELRLGMVGSGTPAYALSWSPATALPLVEGSAHALVLLFTRPPNYGRTRKVGVHRGSITTIESSPFHPFAASGSFDGSVRVHNVMRNALTRTIHHRASVPLYRLAVDSDHASQLPQSEHPEDPKHLEHSEQNTAHPPRYRMVEFSAPELLVNKSISRFDWPPVVQLTGLAWSQAINRGYLLVSTHASGLGRVQWIGSGDE